MSSLATMSRFAEHESNGPEFRDPPLQSQDFEEYQQLSLIMRRILLVHGVAALDQPEYQQAWAESEAIKNRHGGMPPTH